MFGPWGALPIAAACGLFVTARLGALAFPGGRGADRVVGGAVLSSAGVIATVRVLGAAHQLTGAAVLAVLGLAALGLAVGTRRSRPVVPLGQLVSRATAPLLLAALVALGASLLAALWLPVWQWDALGYHLPYVDFALVARGFDAVPDDMPYVSTYPHNAEYLMTALRALLPDDRLVDAAQIPFAVLGAAAAAGIARRVGASRSVALAAGAAWILAPAVFLQMPTDYVDVICAAFFLSAVYFVFSARAPGTEPSEVRRALVLSGLSLALYLGTKPNAPLSAAVVGLLLVASGLRAGERVAVALALLIAATGAETFVVNAIHHGNPVWPVRVQIGPFVLPGTESMQHLLQSGAAAPRLHGSLPSRVVRSWTSLTSPPVFDMRIGGFGPLFLAAFPAALVTLVRRKDAAAWGAALASLASPDPAVARYVLAFPALILALAAPRAASIPARFRPWLGALAGVAAAWQIAYAWPGLEGEGPSLWAYAGMTEPERAEAVGADGPPGPFFEARQRVGPGETYAFDQSMELPYLAWEKDLRYRAVWIPGSLRSSEDVEGFVERENVRVVAAADDSPTGAWLSQKPERFLKLFSCKSAP
jgi:hypothetical protein